MTKLDLQKDLQIFQQLGECDRLAKPVPTAPQFGGHDAHTISVEIPENLLLHLEEEVYSAQAVLEICSAIRELLSGAHVLYQADREKTPIRLAYKDHLPYLKRFNELHSITHGVRLWQRVVGQKIITDFAPHPDKILPLAKLQSIGEIDHALAEYYVEEDGYIADMTRNGLRPPIVRKALSLTGKRFFDTERCIASKFIAD